MRYCNICRVPYPSGSNVSFFKYPKDEKKRNEWIRIIRTHDFSFKNFIKSSRICSLHFSEDCFYSDSRGTKRILKPHAMPSMFWFQCVKKNQNILESENIESTDSFKDSQTISNIKKQSYGPSELLSTTINFEGLIDSFVIPKTNQNVSASENIELNDSSRASPKMSNTTGPSELLSTTINFEELIEPCIIHKTVLNVSASENIATSDSSRKSPTISNMTDPSELPFTITSFEGPLDYSITHKTNPNILTFENIESRDSSQASPTMFKISTDRLRMQLSGLLDSSECRSLQNIPNLNTSFSELDELENIELHELFNDKCLLPGNCELSDPQYLVKDARNGDIVLNQSENQITKIFNLQNQNKVLTQKLNDIQSMIDGLRAENFISDDVADLLSIRCKFGFESGIC